jgi:hypothetical protein
MSSKTKLTNIPTLARRIDDLSRTVDALQQKPEPEPLPADIARLSDIPEPLDQLPLAAKIEELQREIEEVQETARTSPVTDRLAELSAAVESQATQTASIRDDLTETRRWLAEMGRAWQSHKSTVVEQVSAVTARVAELRAVSPDLVARIDQDLAGLADAVHALDVRAAEISATIPALPDDIALLSNIPAPVDLSEILDRVGSLAERVVAVESRTCPDVPDLEPVIADIRIAQRAVDDLPDDLARLSDIPSPVDLSAVRAQIEEISTRLDTLASRPCPEIPDIAPVAAEVAELRETINDIIGGE